jgi:UDP-3-O-acyl-N-acetylglucosamine deacetylase
VKYPVVVVLWEDHIHFDRSPIMETPSKAFLKPVLSAGILYKEDKKAIIVISDIERYDEHDEASYTVILKSAIVATRVFGKIKIESLR